MTDGLGKGVWALFQENKYDIVRKICPSDFDWAGVEPASGLTALHLLVINAIDSDREESKTMAEWLMQHNANPHAMPRPDAHYRFFWWKYPDGGADDDDDEEEDEEDEASPKAGGKKRKFEVGLPDNIEEFTALTLLLELIKIFRGSEQDHHPNVDWTEHKADLEELLQVLTRTDLQPPRREKLRIDAGVVDVWERFQGDCGSHDVTLRAGGGDVTAHEALLGAASRVLQSMLSSAMREGTTKQVDIRDTPQAAASLLLDLLYTGTTQAAVKVDLALSTFDLAHRWQVDHVVAMLEGLLVQKLSTEAFQRIGELAAVKGSADFQESCKRFFAGIDDMDCTPFSRELQEMLGLAAPAPSEQPKAKRRKTL